MERALALPDDAWRRIADEAIELGVLEAVVSGGEPLMRRALTLELLQRLTSGGVGTCLNTNGWFVDEALADALAELPQLLVHVSIDGATAESHDAARGVPGSWRRAVRAVSLLLERGVRVQVVHLVTPRNEPDVERFLEHMWLLGATAVRLSPVADVGGAARAPAGWAVDVRRLRRTIAQARLRYGDELRLRLIDAELFIPSVGGPPPTTLLVRPNGAVMLDSLHPFAFGNAAVEGVGSAWTRLQAGWDAPAVRGWAAGVARPEDLARQSRVPYRDDEELIEPGGDRPSPSARRISHSSRARRVVRAGASRVRSRLPAMPRRHDRPPSDPGALATARRAIVELALARRYRVAELRISGLVSGRRLVRVLDSGRVVRVNESAALALGGGEQTDARELAERLRRRHPERSSEERESAALETVRRLAARGVLIPARAQVPQATVGRSDGAERLVSPVV